MTFVPASSQSQNIFQYISNYDCEMILSFQLFVRPCATQNVRNGPSIFPDILHEGRESKSKKT